MRYELTDGEWAAIKPLLPNKPRGVPAHASGAVIAMRVGILGSGLMAADSDVRAMGVEGGQWGSFGFTQIRNQFWSRALHEA